MKGEGKLVGVFVLGEGWGVGLRSDRRPTLTLGLVPLLRLLLPLQGAKAKAT
jgi:hypothetical protein